MVQWAMAEEVLPETNPSEPGETKLEEVPLIGTVRPSVSDTTGIVPQGSLQIENGFRYLDADQGTHFYTVPETLFRLGIAKNTELRYKSPDLVWIDTDATPPAQGVHQTNLSGMEVGLSHRIPLVKDRWDIALIPVLSLPTGGAQVSQNGVNVTGRMMSTVKLSNRWAVSNMFETAFNPSGSVNPRAVMTPTTFVSYSITPSWAVYGEIATLIPTRGSTNALVQAGTLWAVTPRQQLDARIGTGLTSASSDLFVGAGYSFRLDDLF